MSEKEQGGAGEAKLKACDCHFCGSTATGAAFSRIADDFQGWQVECSTCGAMGPMNRPTEAEAINAWNACRRSSPAPDAEKAAGKSLVILLDAADNIADYHDGGWGLTREVVDQAKAAIIALQSRPAEPAGDVPEAWCFDVSSAPEDIELLVYRHDKPSPWSYGYRAVAMKSEGLWFGEDGDEISEPAAWTRLADIPRSPSAPDLIAAECPSAPNGRHQVDTSMESGPNNCFHCEAPMPTLSAPALNGEKGE